MKKYFYPITNFIANLVALHNVQKIVSNEKSRKQKINLNKIRKEVPVKWRRQKLVPVNYLF
jgi:hypothetical protein